MIKTQETGIERRIACERAYRRGYVQGVKAALCLDDSADVLNWLASLTDWRASIDERGSMTKPPAVEDEI